MEFSEQERLRPRPSGGSGFAGELDLDFESQTESSTAGNSISWDNSLTQDYWYILCYIPTRQERLGVESRR